MSTACLLCGKRRSSRARQTRTSPLFDQKICSRLRCAEFKALLTEAIATSGIVSDVSELHAEPSVPFYAELAGDPPTHTSQARSDTELRPPYVDRSTKPSGRTVRACLGIPGWRAAMVDKQIGLRLG